MMFVSAMVLFVEWIVPYRILTIISNKKQQNHQNIMMRIELTKASIDFR